MVYKMLRGSQQQIIRSIQYGFILSETFHELPFDSLTNLRYHAYFYRFLVAVCTAALILCIFKYSGNQDQVKIFFEKLLTGCLLMMYLNYILFSRCGNGSLFLKMCAILGLMISGGILTCRFGLAEVFPTAAAEVIKIGSLLHKYVLLYVELQ